MHIKTHPQTNPLPCPSFSSSVSLLLSPLALMFQAALVIPRWVEGLKGQKLIFLNKASNITLDLLLTGHFCRSCLSARTANVYFVSGLLFFFFLYKSLHASCGILVMKKLYARSFFCYEKYPSCASRLCPICLLRKC